jgi:transposase
MFWAVFGFEERSGLVPLDGDEEARRKGVTGWVIRALYSAFLAEYVRPGDIFMHDNAPVHTAHIVRELLHEMGIQVMPWPPYSPDLNPIENLWSILKAEIYRLYPELERAPDTEETLALLIRAAKEAWHSIDIDILNSLATKMPNRVEAVIEAKGWYTKY